MKSMIDCDHFYFYYALLWVLCVVGSIIAAFMLCYSNETKNRDNICCPETDFKNEEN